jgi:transporter family-2 protein
MALVITVAFLNGMLNIVNKLVNVRAKQALGMANGNLVNYLEGTAIALVLAVLLGETHLLDGPYLGSIPPLYYLGGVFGLAAMVLTIRGMEGVPVAVSAVVILSGQLLAGFVMDALAGLADLRDLAGLCLVGAGVWWNNSRSRLDAGESVKSGSTVAR